MKKTIILLSSLVSIIALGQHSCGFDHRRDLMDKKFPESKIAREKAERKLMNKGVKNILREYGFLSERPNSSNKLIKMNNTSAYTGQIYEIPVVVHVIESSNEADSRLKVTDDEIKAWIENANNMYATTYGKGFFEEGDGAKGGNVIPFRLVLAKRNPSCEPTSGIVRYDGSTIAGYNEYGIKDAGQDGASDADVRRLAPHWPENSYYNIYIVTGFDGNKTDFGLMGWAYGPEIHNMYYETIMKAPVLKKKDDTTLAHEFGHSLGLAHPFASGNEKTCPPSTGDCTVDDDKVCDTEATKSLGGARVPTENDINPCTNRNYEGVQYNIMNYTFQPRKFTAGQRDRALAMFLSQKGNLVKSLAGKEIDNNINLAKNACVINASDNPNTNFSIGITRVQLGDIDVESTSYSGNGKFYNDYTNPCHSITYTDILEGKESSITITKPSVNKQEIIAWIDYNDNGIFEDDEKIIGGIRMENTESSKTFTFTPPTSAVKGKYLRMRVRGDWTARTACANTQFGEAEDYAVRIVPENWVDPATQTNNITEGRVGINTEEPKATLDVRETTDVPETQPQGVLFPNFTTEQRATFRDVAEGTMIFNMTLKCLEIYSNGAWKCLN